MRIVVALALMATICVATSAHAQQAGERACHENGLPCEQWVDSPHELGFCMDGECNVHTSIAQLESMALGVRLRAMGVLLALGAGALALSVALSLADRARARRNAGALAQRPLRESLARRVARWSVPLVLVVSAGMALGARRVALQALRRVDQYATDRPRATPRSEGVSGYPSPPLFVHAGDASRIVAVLYDAGNPTSTRVVALDPATGRAAWSRDGTSWLDDPTWVVQAGDEIVVITGSGQVEARDAMSGVVRRTGHIEYRLLGVQPLRDAGALALWDVRGPYWRLDLASLTVSMSSDNVNFRDGKSRETPPAVRAAAPDAYLVDVRPTKGGVVGLAARKGARTLIAAFGDPLSVRWSLQVELEDNPYGLFPWSVVDELVLTSERCEAGRCLVARDVPTGAVAWSVARKEPVRSIVYDDGRALYLDSDLGDRVAFEIRRRDTGAVVGRWPD
jgi:hypothetical protein